MILDYFHLFELDDTTRMRAKNDTHTAVQHAQNRVKLACPLTDRCGPGERSLKYIDVDVEVHRLFVNLIHLMRINTSHESSMHAMPPPPMAADPPPSSVRDCPTTATPTYGDGTRRSGPVC